MKPRRLRNERMRLLVLELAVVVPALALIGFSIMHLKSIQRDRAVEAAIQRDFDRMLAISEKQINGKLVDMVEETRQAFPQPADPEAEQKLADILERYPWAAHVFLWDHNAGMTFVSRSRRMYESDFRTESQKMDAMVSGWFPLEGKELIRKLWEVDKEEGHPIEFFDNEVPRGKESEYQTVALFHIPGLPHDRQTIGGVAFDADYLKNSFFPYILNYMADCPENRAPAETEQNRPAMVLQAKSGQVLATSRNWDGGSSPEVVRKLETGLPGLILGIKYRGTTIAALSAHFLNTSYLILGGLSLLMGLGIFLSYRSVNREMAVAKLKSDFVSNVSHELRTPLSLIRLFAETLEMGRLSAPEKYQEYYRIIRKESERLSALINNILDFSRIEAGRKEYDFRQTDIADLVRQTLDSYRYEIEQHGFTFEENIEEGLPPVVVDREAIARSVLNLVNNAVKYSIDNKFLAVNVYRLDGTVKLEVVDHGIGIPPSEQNKVFEKFYRASDPLVHNTKGSGLGLSLVRHVIEAHGGRVWVQSTPGRGSKFTIDLPVEIGAPAAKAGVAA